jgi:hypothetical protein
VGAFLIFAIYITCPNHLTVIIFGDSIHYETALRNPDLYSQLVSLNPLNGSKKKSKQAQRDPPGERN